MWCQNILALAILEPSLRQPPADLRQPHQNLLPRIQDGLQIYIFGPLAGRGCTFHLCFAEYPCRPLSISIRYCSSHASSVPIVSLEEELTSCTMRRVEL